jgi:hypothetical protein
MLDGEAVLRADLSCGQSGGVTFANWSSGLDAVPAGVYRSLSFKLRVDSVLIVDMLDLGFVDHTGQAVTTRKALNPFVASPVANAFMQVTAEFSSLAIASSGFSQINVSYNGAGAGPVLYFDDVVLCGP